MELHTDFYQLGKVELELNNALIPAFILDLNTDENEQTKIVLNFEDNALPDGEYEITNIHLPLNFTELEKQQMKVDDEIEVFTKIDGIKKWVKAKIKFIYNDILGIDFVNDEIKSKISTISKQDQIKLGDKTAHALFKISDIRPLNKSVKITSNLFLKKEVELGELELLENKDFSWLNDQNVHQLFKAKVNAISVKYNSTKKCLTIICYNENLNSSVVESILKRIDMFIDLHIKSLKNRAVLQVTLDNLTKKLNEAKINFKSSQITLVDNLYELKVSVPRGIIGLSIGSNGSVFKIFFFSSFN